MGLLGACVLLLAPTMRYRRSTAAGGSFFFTVNLQDRSLDLLLRHVDALRAVTRQVRARHPFEIVAMVVMPEHLHAIWRLPEGDADFALRWSLIKAGFSRSIPAVEAVGKSRSGKRERGIWQRRYWEHQIRDEADLERHVDYIHYNPVKHGHVRRAIDWPHSSIHRYVRQGLRAPDWGSVMPDDSEGFGER
jgi:putative transposase